MSNGFYLTLMIGPVVPVPVSQEVLDALVSVEVYSKPKAPSGFQLTFTLSNRSPLHTLFLFTGGISIPMVRVVIVVTINGRSEVLMDGVMTHHQISPGADPGHSTLTVTGEDMSRVMDYLDLSGIPYPAMPIEGSVALILLKYMMFGVVPMVIPSPLIDIPIPIKQIFRQKGTDFNYVTKLAKAIGYVFYIEPGPEPGMSIAYWGPEIRVGAPQPALNINMDAHTNVESMKFSFDTEHKVLPILFIQNELSGITIPIPVPDITPLSPPLGIIPPIPKKIMQITGTAKMSMIRTALIGLAKAAKTADAASAEGTLDTLRYGRVLKAHKLVGVRGAGPAFDGLYYVKSVTHSIKRGEYKQKFTLIRNGLISTLRQVPV